MINWRDIISSSRSGNVTARNGQSAGQIPLAKPQFQLNVMRRHQTNYPAWQTAFSEDALRRAWQPVRAKKGAANGQSVLEFEQQLDSHLSNLRQELLAGRYRPKPVKQILIPKRDDRWRPITLWTVRDRIVQRAVYNYLEPMWEPRFLGCNHGYRIGYSTNSAAQAIRAAHSAGYHYVWDADIKDCFGNMRNSTILKRMHEWKTPAQVQQLIERWLKTRIQNAWGKRKQAATSQGGVISPLLCNLYLHGLDRALQQRRWRLVRYADDFVVMAQSQRSLQVGIRHATHTLHQLGLQINEDKTRQTHFENGFKFVGWFFVRDEAYKL